MCDIIPNVDVQVDIFVEDEGEIAENDLVTIKVRFGCVQYGTQLSNCSTRASKLSLACQFSLFGTGLENVGEY